MFADSELYQQILGNIQSSTGVVYCVKRDKFKKK
jgi:hypothetical protein